MALMVEAMVQEDCREKASAAIIWLSELTMVKVLHNKIIAKWSPRLLSGDQRLMFSVS